MIARAGSGWQTVLADLSLILFMVTAGVVNQQPEHAAPAPAGQNAILPALETPVAVWTEAQGTISLRDWLHRSATDKRLRLTLLAPPSSAPHALALAQGLEHPARVVIDPDAPPQIQATLAYDRLQPNPSPDRAPLMKEP